MKRFSLIIACAGLLLDGCLLRRNSPVLPVGGSVVRDQLVIYSDFTLPKNHRLIEELVALRNDVSSKLQLPASDEPIHVYLFDNPQRYGTYMAKHYPQFADRRAFFVQDDTTLTVYAFWGDRVAEDLRHEVAHGYLHSVVPNLPLWLDEGLAEYFEVPRGQRGIHQRHIDLLWESFRKDEWTPDLPRLEKMQYAEEMTQLDYAESWLWIHLLMESTPQRLQGLQQNLLRLRDTGSAPPLWQMLSAAEISTQRTLIRHLKEVAER